MPVDMHVGEARLVPKEVIVQGRHLDAMVEQGGHDGTDLVLEQA